MELSKGIVVKAGKVHGTVFGGPFKRYEPKTRRLVGIKMAVEIDHPHDVSVPTVDFSVPDPGDLTKGIKAAFDSMADGNDIYVGCMGGIGRTGLFMAVMVRALGSYEKNEVDPVTYVRKYYNAHAVETPEQKEYVETFDIKPLVQHLKKLNVRQKTVYRTLSVWESLVRYFYRRMLKSKSRKTV